MLQHSMQTQATEPFEGNDEHIYPICACSQISVGLHRFTYDNVYGSDAGDSAVNLYPDCVQPLVAGLFKGYNATVFAYGEPNAAAAVTKRRHASTSPLGSLQRVPSHLQLLCLQ
jgi:kinesin family protein 4/21/27